ncbi:MAG: glutathione S-transferase N-terminal domain-containing protein [Candidatus Pacebacteria bacterium]|nr:glutathione S-transferase N-terminal domain-containing protein [Candidatus Paceibacterota bacterium]
MMTLYVKTGCPYCQKVLDYAEQNSIQFELKNVADPAISEELIKIGGKRQMPFLVDSEAAISMYESDDIVKYLDQKVHEG